MADSASAPAPPRWLPLLVALGAMALYFLRFGYDYGWSDQDELIPYLKHLLNPERFTSDWFVMAQADGFNVRTFFIYLVYVPAMVLPLWLVFLIGYVLCWLAIAVAVFKISWFHTQNLVAASLAVVLVAVFTPQWTLGGNDLIHSMWAPSMIAWALGLWAFYALLRRRVAWSAALLGVAMWMQALVGLQLALVFGLALLIPLAQTRRREELKAVLTFSVVFLLVAAVALIPLVVSQLGHPAVTASSDAPSLFYIIGAFRNPHHYLFHAFPMRSLVRFGLLVVLGVGSLVWLRRKGSFARHTLFAHLLVIIAVIGAGAYVGTELLPVLFVAKLQLFKTTVLAKLLLLLLFTAALSQLLPRVLQQALTSLLEKTSWIAAAVGLVWLFIAAGLLLPIDSVYSRARPLVRQQTPAHALHAWIRENTPRAAVFAAPPSWSGFRTQAERATVINFKAFPYRDDLIVEWFERLRLLAPVPLPERSSPSVQQQLDDAYHALSVEDLLEATSEIPFGYVVREQPFATPPAQMAQVFANEAGTVYRLQPAGGGP